MNAILARTHLIVLTEAAVYWRLARADNSSPGLPMSRLIYWQKITRSSSRNTKEILMVIVFPQGSMRTLSAHKTSSANCCVAKTFHVPSLFADNPASSTTYHPPSLLPSADVKVKVKQEKSTQFFKALKRMPRTTVDLSSPSPAKRPRPSFIGPPQS